MAWEWVGAGSAATTGVVGIFFTWLAGHQARNQNVTLARRAQRHELRRAQTERRATAYVEALDIAERLGNWAQRVRPVVDVGQEPPAFPPLDQQARASALVLAHGSATVQQYLERWRDSVNAVARADFQIRVSLETREQHGMSSIAYNDIWMQLEVEWRPGERAARAALAQAINDELAGRKPAPPPPDDDDPPPQDESNEGGSGRAT